jgi:hypothetical protein
MEMINWFRNGRKMNVPFIDYFNTDQYVFANHFDFQPIEHFHEIISTIESGLDVFNLNDGKKIDEDEDDTYCVMEG